MKVNADLLPMKLHYFLLFGGTAPLIPYLPVYLNQNLHISYKGVGFIYTILPFLGLIAKTTSGALADLFHIRRSIFISSIIVCAVGFFSLCFAPPMPYQTNDAPARIQFDCSSPGSYIRHSLHKQKCWTRFKKNGTTTCELQCEATQSTMEEMCKNWKIPPSQCLDVLEFTSFSHLNHVVEDQIEMFLQVSNLTYVDTEVPRPICDHPIRTNCTAKCNNVKLMAYFGIPNKILISSYQQIFDQSSFWIFFVLMSFAWSGLAICVVMSDTICFQLLGAEGHKYGKTRLFGSVGWGFVVILTGFMIDMTSSHTGDKNYMAAFILSICIMSVDLLVATRLKVGGSETREKINVRDMLQLLADPRISTFILCCFVVGLATGTLWTYQLMLVEETVYAWDCHFQYMKLLQGLIVGVACFGGELPFFFVAEYFIDKLGHINCMSMVIGVFGVRFILYSLVTNPWLFLPIELLNGLTFGIFYAAMTSFASIVAPKGAQATVQGIMGAIFEGLGIASGGMVGGALFASVGGAKAFLYVGIFNAAFAFFHIVLQFVLKRVCSRSMLRVGGSRSLSGYLAPSDSANPVGDSILHEED